MRKYIYIKNDDAFPWIHSFMLDKGSIIELQIFLIIKVVGQGYIYGLYIHE